MQTAVVDRTTGTVVSDESDHCGVSWAAIFAGAAGAAALSYILVILGFGLGLSSVSPWSTTGADAKTLTIVTAIWLAFTQIAASGMGGYLAGRLRSKWTSIHTDEVFFRDTAHGFLSWAVASLVVAAFLASSIASIVSGGASMAGSALGGAGAAASEAIGKVANENGDSAGYFIDSMFRTDASVAATPTTPDANEGSTRAEAVRIFANDIASGSLSAGDKTYLGQIVARRTGLAQAEAEQRVDSAFTNLKQTIDTAKTKAKEAADIARKATAHAALWLFVSLLCGAFFASLAATFGGRRRDDMAVVTTTRTAR